MAGLYVHIPYCRRACHYCNFHFSTQLAEAEALVEALLKEMAIQQNYLSGEPIESVYIGGGTPSLLPPSALGRILSAADKHFGMRCVREVTMEANPEDLHLDYLKAIKNLGVTRLSIGVQSFHEPHLTLMNRTHTSAASIKSVEDARRVGFSSLSIDLIYGLPHPHHGPWKNDLKTALSLDTEHISAYALTLEERTVLHKKVQQHQFEPASQDFVAEQYHLLCRALGQADYEHYEVSNFARCGYQAVHNANYWKDKKYLGVGPSAHSYDHNSRQRNISHNARYIQALQAGRIPCIKEHLSAEQKCHEYLLTCLRTRAGVDLLHLQRAFGYEIERLDAPTCTTLFGSRSLIRAENRLLIPEDRWIVADEIILRLMP